MHRRRNSSLRAPLAACLSILLIALVPIGLHAQLPKTVRVFKTPAVTTAQASYTTTTVAARKAYSQALDAALKTAMQGGNLPEANAINAVKTALSAGQEPPPADFKSAAAIQAKTAYDAAVNRARAQDLSALQTAQKSVLASGDLNEANSLKSEIDEVSGKAAATASSGAVVMESADLTVSGQGFNVSLLEDNALGWSNRPYRWQKIPASLKGAQYTKTNLNGQPQIKIRAKKDTTVQVVTTANVAADQPTRLAGWDRTGIRFTTTHNAEMVVFKRKVSAGEELDIPVVNWACTMVVLPEK
jgi:hypothetical protein